MTKKVTFGARPKTATVIDPAAAEAFVAGSSEHPAAAPVASSAPEPEKQADKVKPKRLTIDLDPPLHKKLKARALEEDTTIADVARKLLQDWAYR
jgi:hypothetical protein